MGELRASEVCRARAVVVGEMGLKVTEDQDGMVLSSFSSLTQQIFPEVSQVPGPVL